MMSVAAEVKRADFAPRSIHRELPALVFTLAGIVADLSRWRLRQSAKLIGGWRLREGAKRFVRFHTCACCARASQ